MGAIVHHVADQVVDLQEEEDLDCHFRPDGYYEVYRTSEGLAGARDEIPLQRAHGYDTREVSGEFLREAEPNLKPGTAGGIFYPEAAIVDPARFLDTLKRAAVLRGLSVRTGAEVSEVLATGGRPFRPPIPGLDLKNVWFMTHPDDAASLVQTIDRQGLKKAVLVGAGFIGLEMAEALINKGLDVTMVEMMGQIMPGIIDEDIARLSETISYELFCHAGCHGRREYINK